MYLALSPRVQVHENGMKVGMKNAIELLDDLSDYYDFAINEECHDWDECDVSVGLKWILPCMNNLQYFSTLCRSFSISQVSM